LVCKLSGPASVVAGQPVQLRLRLSNTGSQAVDVLTWGTPFETGWFSPYLSVSRGGQTLAYGGASLKRGDPRAQDYVRVEAGQSREATLELSTAFDLRTPGHYVVTPSLVLHDVVLDGAEALPRPRDRHATQPLACAKLEFTVTR
jgi:hypothetical protein